MSQTDEKRPDVGHAARDWWQNLQPDPTHRGDRAALARLRRASLTSAMAEEATLHLFYALGQRSPETLPRVAMLACILAHVRADDRERKFAQAIGRRSFGDPDSAVMKKLRFQRLAEANGEEEILRGFRRAVDLLGGVANVADLARLVWFFENEKTRRDFAFDYFGAGFAAPANQPQ